MRDNFKLMLKLLFFSLIISLSLNASNNLNSSLKKISIQYTLHDVIRTDNFKKLKYLVKEGKNINKRDSYGYSPLHLAVRLSKYNVIKYLIENGATINTVDAYGDTPLIDSTRNNETEISKLLICNGANRTVVDNNGITTLENSVQNQKIVDLLLTDNLKPYCQKNIDIDINPINLKKDNFYSDTICGNIIDGFVTNINMTFKDQNDEIFGPYPAEIDNKNTKWCIKKTQLSLKNGHYQVIATATDNVPNVDKVTMNEYLHAPQLNFIFENKNKTSNPSPRICGTSNSKFMNTLEIVMQNKDENLYGIFNGTFNAKEKKWCVKITDTLPYGYYNIKAHISDSYGQTIDIIKKNYFVNTEKFIINKTIQTLDEEKPTINISNLSENFGHKPKICGEILAGEIYKGQLTITNQKKYVKDISNITIDNENKFWCVQIQKRLDNGIYNINMEVVNKQHRKSNITKKIKIYTIPKLYEALVSEFRDDLDKWNAKINKNDLTFSFEDKLFYNKKHEISKKYKKILNNFFPRYIAITSLFQKNIDTITIEGDSSSKNVLSYLNKIVNKNIANNILWILKTLKSNSLSSSKLVYNKSNKQNKELYRKIEFKIKNNNSTLIK